MIFLIITGALFLILGGFYLSNSWMRYHEWKGGTIIVVLSLAAIIFGTVNLPVFHHNSSSQATRSSQSSIQSQTAQTSSSVSQQGQKEDYALLQLQKSYAKFGDVSFNSNTKTFTITATASDAKQAMNDIVTTPDNADQDGWGSITKSVRQASKQLVKLLGHGYRMKVVQPGHHNKNMLVVKDGHTTYNIASDSSSATSSSTAQ